MLFAFVKNRFILWAGAFARRIKAAVEESGTILIDEAGLQSDPRSTAETLNPARAGPKMLLARKLSDSQRETICIQ